MHLWGRAASGFMIGVPIGLFESAEVLHRQHTISIAHAALLVFYALLFDGIVCAILIAILPQRWTDRWRTRTSKALLLLVTLCAVIVAAFQLRLPPKHSIGSAANNAQPNIVLISIDTLRFDHMGCYRYRNAVTPHLDALAKESVLFEDATSPIPLTGPSHASMLTGKYPTTHGVGTNGIRLPPAEKTIMNALRKAGYHTGAFVSGWTLKDESIGLADRFDVYDDELGFSSLFPDIAFELVIPYFAQRYLGKHFKLKLRPLERPADITAQHAIEWIDQHHDHPVFAFIHFFDAHGPHVDPSKSRIHPSEPPFDYRKPKRQILDMIVNPQIIQQTIKNYDHEISYADSQVGVLMDYLNKLPRKTAIIFTADHGESLTEHAFYFDHGEFLYETCVHVPMIIRFPDRSHANQRITSQVRLIDVASTVLEIAGVPADSSMDGKSILKVVDGSDVGPRDSYGAIRQGGGTGTRARYYVRSGGFKLIWNYDNRLAFSMMPQSEELYDLRTDPSEVHNLTGSRTDVQNQLREKLIEFISRDKNMKTTPDENVIEQLKALGYTD